MTGRTLEEMKLDIIRWKLEAAERRAEEEFDELCHERPKEYGVKLGCIRLATYKGTFYRILHEDIVWCISEPSLSSIERIWELEKADKERHEIAYAE